MENKIADIVIPKLQEALGPLLLQAVTDDVKQVRTTVSWCVEFTIMVHGSIKHFNWSTINH